MVLPTDGSADGLKGVEGVDTEANIYAEEMEKNMVAGLQHKLMDEYEKGAKDREKLIDAQTEA